MVHGDSLERESPENPSSATNNTGLGVFAVLQKFRLWCDVKRHPPFTTLIISSNEIAQWQRVQKGKARSERRERRQSFVNLQEGHPLGSRHGSRGLLEDQQRDIRTDW